MREENLIHFLLTKEDMAGFNVSWDAATFQSTSFVRRKTSDDESCIELSSVSIHFLRKKEDFTSSLRDEDLKMFQSTSFARRKTSSINTGSFAVHVSIHFLRKKEDKILMIWQKH